MNQYLPLLLSVCLPATLLSATKVNTKLTYLEQSTNNSSVNASSTDTRHFLDSQKRTLWQNRSILIMIEQLQAQMLQILETAEHSLSEQALEAFEAIMYKLEDLDLIASQIQKILENSEILVDLAYQTGDQLDTLQYEAELSLANDLALQSKIDILLSQID